MRFSTYAGRAISHELARLARYAGVVSLPANGARDLEAAARALSAARLSPFASDLEPAGREDDPAEAFARRAGREDDCEAVGRLLALVPPRDRLVLRLRYCEGLSAREIGEALGVSKSAAQHEVSRARRRAREAAGLGRGGR